MRSSSDCVKPKGRQICFRLQLEHATMQVLLCAGRSTEQSMSAACSGSRDGWPLRLWSPRIIGTRDYPESSVTAKADPGQAKRRLLAYIGRAQGACPRPGTRMPASPHQELLERLRRFIPPQRLVTDPLRRLAWGSDASFYRLVPQLVVVVER
jgi:hypothetical protein